MGRCPGLMACRPFRAETKRIQVLAENSPNGAVILEPGASPQAVSGVMRVHGRSKPAPRRLDLSSKVPNLSSHHPLDLKRMQ